MFCVLKRFFASKNSSRRCAPRQRHEPRVAQVEVDDTAEPAGVALEAERPIVGDAVEVQIEVRADVERQAAVGLEDHAELVVVQQRRRRCRSPTPIGAMTVDTENVCVWLNGVTPLSRSRFEGSDTRSSPLPTT